MSENWQYQFPVVEVVTDEAPRPRNVPYPNSQWGKGNQKPYYGPPGYQRPCERSSNNGPAKGRIAKEPSCISRERFGAEGVKQTRRMVKDRVMKNRCK